MAFLFVFTAGVFTLWMMVKLKKAESSIQNLQALLAHSTRPAIGVGSTEMGVD